MSPQWCHYRAYILFKLFTIMWLCSITCPIGESHPGLQYGKQTCESCIRASLHVYVHDLPHGLKICPLF